MLNPVTNDLHACQKVVLMFGEATDSVADKLISDETSRLPPSSGVLYVGPMLLDRLPNACSAVFRLRMRTKMPPVQQESYIGPNTKMGYVDHLPSTVCRRSGIGGLRSATLRQNWLTTDKGRSVRNTV